MKKTNPYATFFAALLLGFLITSCSNPNPVEYNNELMTLMNDNEKDMNAMNVAMSTGDYTKAETVRSTWAKNLDNAIGKVSKIKAIKNDEGLKSAVEEGLKQYKKIASQDYVKLIELRTKEKGGDASLQPQIQSVLHTINNGFETIGATVNKAGDAFAQKHTAAE